MVNYNNSKIYKICCRDTEIKDIYIGSTTNFTKRKYCHKTCCNNPNDKRYHLKLYQFIRNNGGWENWDMVLVQEVSCENKLQLHKIERSYIEKNNSTLNCNIPNRGRNEYLKYNNLKTGRSKSGKFFTYSKEKIKCSICNIELGKTYFKKHKKSDLHINNIPYLKPPNN